jgi:hypothetical protein
VSWNAWGVGFGSTEPSKSNPDAGLLKEPKNAMYGMFAIFLLTGFLWSAFSMLVGLGVIPLPSGFANIRGIITLALIGLAFVLLFIARLGVAFSSKGNWNLSAWGHLAYTFTFWAVIAAFLEMWHQLRGPGRPPLKVEFHS